MLLKFLYPFHESLSFLNILIYPSFRMVMAALTAGLITFTCYPAFIRWLKRLSFGQEVRDCGPQSHLKKKGTPTMGGLLFLAAIIVSSLLWGDIEYLGLWLLLFVTVGFGLLGMVDDLRKIRKSNTKGLSPKAKLFWQATIALVALLIYHQDISSSTLISFPFVAIDRFAIDLPLFLFIPFAMFIIVGTSNAVNLTDGLDGLAIGPVIVSATIFLILAYAAGTVIADFNVADYLKIPTSPRAMS